MISLPDSFLQAALEAERQAAAAPRGDAPSRSKPASDPGLAPGAAPAREAPVALKVEVRVGALPAERQARWHELWGRLLQPAPGEYHPETETACE